MTIEEMIGQQIERLERWIHIYAKHLENAQHPLDKDDKLVRDLVYQKIEEVQRLRKILSFWKTEKERLAKSGK